MAHLSPAAREDLLDHYAYIHARQPAAADRLLEEVWRVADQLARFPRSGHRHRDGAFGDAELREYALAEYSLRLFYIVEDQRVEIILIVHGSREVRQLLRRRSSG